MEIDLTRFFEPWLLFLADDPATRVLQLSMLGIGSVGIFLVFYTARDILQRTHSFVYMFVCIVIAALLPGIGFLIYVLIRPTMTLRQRELERKIDELLEGKSMKKKARED